MSEQKPTFTIWIHRFINYDKTKNINFGNDNKISFINEENSCRITIRFKKDSHNKLEFILGKSFYISSKQSLMFKKHYKSNYLKFSYSDMKMKEETNGSLKNLLDPIIKNNIKFIDNVIYNFSKSYSIPLFDYINYSAQFPINFEPLMIRWKHNKGCSISYSQIVIGYCGIPQRFDNKNVSNFCDVNMAKNEEYFNIFWEAWITRSFNLKSAIILSWAALEISIKKYLETNYQDLKDLFFNLPSPSPFKMLNEILPNIFQQKGFLIRLNKIHLEGLKKIENERNELVHKGIFNLSKEKVNKRLGLIKDVLYFIEFANGDINAKDNLSKSFKKELINL